MKRWKKCTAVLITMCVLFTACSNKNDNIKKENKSEIKIENSKSDAEEKATAEAKTAEATKAAKEAQAVVDAKVAAEAEAKAASEAKVAATAKAAVEVKAASEAKIAAAAKEAERVKAAAETTVIAEPKSTSGKSKTIVIDPGHANRSNLIKEALAPGSSVLKIKDGGGAQGIATKTPEYLVNMRVAVKLRTLLQANGFNVVMTKTDNSLSLGNIERANIGNNAKANLVVRIHADSTDNSSVTGASMLVPAAMNANTKVIHDESRRCGAIVLNALTSEVGMNNRGVVEHSDMTGFNWSTVPVILVEMGFLSNAGEDKLLSSDSYESKLALGLLHGIMAAER